MILEIEEARKKGLKIKPGYKVKLQRNPSLKTPRIPKYLDGQWIEVLKINSHKNFDYVNPKSGFISSCQLADITHIEFK